MKKPVFAFCLLAGVSGCATIETHEHAEAIQSSVEAGIKQARASLSAAPSVSAPKSSPLVYEDLPWVSTRAVALTERDPDFLRKKVVFSEPYPLPVNVVLSKMSAPGVIGVPLAYEQDVVESSASRGGDGPPANIPVPPAQDSAGGTGGSLAPQVIDLTGFVAKGLPQEQDVKISINHVEGTVRDLLDATAHALKARWRYEKEHHRIVFYRYETKTFRIAMVPGNATAESTLSSNSGQNTSGGGIRSTTKYDTKKGVWESVSDTIKTMMSSKGQFTVSEAMGTVTVRDVPDVVQRVSEYVKKVNDALAQQVTIEVKVYKLESTEQDIRGVNWSAAFQSVGFNVNMITPRGNTAGQTGMVLSIPDTAVGDLRHWVGSQAMLDMLSKIGKVSTMTSTTLQTINNQSAPVSISKKINYVKSVSSTTGANIGVTSAVEQAEIDTGFSINVLPHVQDNGRDLLLQVSLSMSTLDKLEPFTTGGQTVQIPQVSSRDFMQRVRMSSGQTLVLAGFESIQSADNSQGPIDAKAWAVGGVKDLNNAKESIVILMTPYITRAENMI